MNDLIFYLPKLLYTILSYTIVIIIITYIFKIFTQTFSAINNFNFNKYFYYFLVPTYVLIMHQTTAIHWGVYPSI